MKKISLVIFLIIVSALSNAQTLNEKLPTVQSFVVGGVSIKIPVFDTTMIEVGKENRKNMEIFVPPDNRLISAYIVKTDLHILFTGDTTKMISKYALVEIPRGIESIDCDANGFNSVVKGVIESFGDKFSTLFKESEDEFNRRIKSLKLSKLESKMGEPIRLGCLFSKQDIIGFGTLASHEMGDSSIKMAMVFSLIRVKKRVLFIYLYTQFKDNETINWLRKIGEKWSDEILKINNVK
ncbi:MAG: hypothetical protein K2X37_13385 [Chitinophagaceae bacterium]|nr:hypothetical protein [Chitinophagaceae bacterium]